MLIVAADGRARSSSETPGHPPPDQDSEEYYAQVRGAYDRIAESYDASVGQYAVSRRAKQLALQVIQSNVRPGGRLLDIGCYTGIEALLLAQKGYSVVGVDLSPEMIRLAREKAASRRLADRVAFRTLRASDVGTLADEQVPRFQGAYSVYGTLNLEPDLGRFKEGLCRVLEDEGVFVCGLLNPTVLYELLADPWILKFHGYRKLAKVRVRTRIGLGSDTVEAFLYGPHEFSRLMAPEFELDRALGLHVLYPPPRGRDGSGLWWVARALDSLERRVETHYPFTHLGFFSLLVFRKTVA